MKTWLWPDQVLGKRRSRQMRDEHNETVAIAVGLLDALRDMVETFGDHAQYADGDAAVIDNAKAMIRIAEGGAK